MSLFDPMPGDLISAADFFGLNPKRNTLMPELSKLSPAALKAAMQGGTDAWGSWASSAEHVRYMEPVPPRMRRRCSCGCKKRATYSGKCNGIALYTACEMSVARWVKIGHR